MADLFLENEALKVGFNYHGAELVSLVRKDTNEEVMWCGDSAYWGRVSPVLFPFVGKLNQQKYTYQGKTYENVPQHGYARDCDFTLASKLDQEVWFELTPDETFKARYPFDFLLRIGYKLEGKSVHVMWNVVNTGSADLHFSIGAHPAFACAGGVGGYHMDFHANIDSLESGILTSNGVMGDGTKNIPFENGKLYLSDELLAEDALVFDAKEVHTITLVSNEGKEMLQVRFDAPLVGIWSPAGKKAPFVCIEPWYGRCDSEGFEEDLSKRAYANTIAAGHSFNKEYVIDIL